MTDLFHFPTASRGDADVARWFAESDPLRSIAEHWFDAMRSCGPDVRELLHDGHPTACVDDAAFAYVDTFSRHVNVGFYQGATLPDPAKILEGTGRRMRHVKVGAGHTAAPDDLEALTKAAYADMRARLPR